MHRITDTKLFYIFINTGNEFTNYIINDCGGTVPGLPTVGTDPGRRYNFGFRVSHADITIHNRNRTFHFLKDNKMI